MHIIQHIWTRSAATRSSHTFWAHVESYYEKKTPLYHVFQHLYVNCLWCLVFFFIQSLYTLSFIVFTKCLNTQRINTNFLSIESMSIGIEFTKFSVGKSAATVGSVECVGEKCTDRYYDHVFISFKRSITGRSEIGEWMNEVISIIWKLDEDLSPNLVRHSSLSKNIYILNSTTRFQVHFAY